MAEITTITDITSARRVMRRYLAHADGQLPADTFEQLEKLVDSPSPVDGICRTAELLYARSNELDDEGRVACAQLASFAATNFWQGMGDGNRGGLIAQAMNRDMGGKAMPGQPRPQKQADDPKPDAGFVREATEAATEDAPAAPADGDTAAAS